MFILFIKKHVPIEKKRPLIKTEMIQKYTAILDNKNCIISENFISEKIILPNKLNKNFRAN
jgi:hypothetical protein